MCKNGRIPLPNITLSIDDDLLEAGRKYAKDHNTSLNALVRDLLSKTVTRSSGGRLEEGFKLADKFHFSSKGRRWKREDLYDV
jgi:lysophospholipase L1-like esterase